jgi:hypothetical protein
MDTMSAFVRGESARAAGARTKVFDWDKAALIIRDRKPIRVEAGLSGDWEYTGGTIYRAGAVVRDEYTYLASVWATPQIAIDGDVEDCWVYEDESNGWEAHTKWPDSSLAILLAPTVVA